MDEDDKLRVKVMEVCFGDMPNDPRHFDWVLFRHGSYFAFPRQEPDVDIEEIGLELMDRYGSVIIGIQNSTLHNHIRIPCLPTKNTAVLMFILVRVFSS